MTGTIKITEVKEYEDSKFVKQLSNGKDLRGIYLRVSGINQDGHKCSFFSPQCIVATTLDGLYNESIDKDTGNFYYVNNNRVLPVVKVGDSIVIKYGKEALYGSIVNYKNVIRLS